MLSLGSGVENRLQGGTRASLAKWNAARARVAQGQGNAALLCIGDSTTAGAGSNGALKTSNAGQHGWPTVVAGLLPHAQWSSFFGDANNAGSGLNNWNNQLTQGASWTTIGTGFGGHYFFDASGTSTLSFAPSQTFDTIVVYWGERGTGGAGGGTFTVNVDGGAALATIDTRVSPFTQMNSTTLTVPGGLATHTININRVTSGTAGILISGVEVYTAAVPIVRVLNGGFISATTLTYIQTANVPDYLNVVNYLQPDLAIISNWLNDASGATPIATFMSRLQTVINACRVTGDVMFVTPPPPNTAAISQVLQDQYNAAFLSLASINNIPVLQTNKIDANWANFTASNGAGRMFDNLHPSGAGYTSWGTAIASAIVSY